MLPNNSTLIFRMIFITSNVVLRANVFIYSLIACFSVNASGMDGNILSMMHVSNLSESSSNKDFIIINFLILIKFNSVVSQQNKRFPGTFRLHEVYHSTIRITIVLPYCHQFHRVRRSIGYQFLGFCDWHTSIQINRPQSREASCSIRLVLRMWAHFLIQTSFDEYQLGLYIIYWWYALPWISFLRVISSYGYRCKKFIYST